MRPKTWIALATAGVLTLGTGVLALMARDAKADFDAELERAPNTKSSVEDARTRMVRYAALTDAVGAAALMATGATIYFALTEKPTLTATPAGQDSAGRRATRLSLTASPGGLSVGGKF
jgi:hypothetical protein